mmetsp:Transcript_7352/g.18015  ORF Transcript_7352/g.18015 Transcript_7352/m.18015 type:complete len:214 (+) Transcript_7352:1635-2276(+)
MERLQLRTVFCDPCRGMILRKETVTVACRQHVDVTGECQENRPVAALGSDGSGTGSEYISSFFSAKTTTHPLDSNHNLRLRSSGNFCTVLLSVRRCLSRTMDCQIGCTLRRNDKCRLRFQIKVLLCAGSERSRNLNDIANFRLRRCVWDSHQFLESIAVASCDFVTCHFVVTIACNCVFNRNRDLRSVCRPILDSSPPSSRFCCLQCLASYDS